MLELVNQLGALVLKQVLLSMRSKIATLALLFGPSIFVLLCAFISDSNLNQISVASGNATSLDNGNQSEWTTTTLGSGSPLQPCRMYTRGGAPRPDDPCIAIAYAPASDPKVKQVMERVALKSNLNHAQVLGDVVGEMPGIREGLGFVDVVGFDTETGLEQYMRRSDTYGYINAAVFFNEESFVNKVTTSPEDYDESSFAGERVEPLEPEKSILAYRIMTNTSTSIDNQDIFNSKLNIQTHITESLMAALSKQDEATLKINLKTFDPNSKQVAQDTSFLLNRMVVPFMYTGSLGLFVVVLQGVVMEKVTGKLDHLRSMGLSEGCYWLSWMIYYSIISFLSVIPSMIMGHATGLVLFTNTPFVIMFLVLFINNMAMVSFALFLSPFVSGTWGANAVSVLVCVGVLLGLIFVLVFDRALLFENYNQFTIGGAMIDAIHHLPVLAFPRIMENMFAMTSSFRGEPHRTYTAGDFAGGTYQYLDVMNAFGPRATQIDPRKVLPSREACIDPYLFAAGMEVPDSLEERAFLDAYRCLDYSNPGDSTPGEYFPLPRSKAADYSTAAEMTSQISAKCIPGWSWAAGETKEMCQKANGLFIPRPVDGPVHIFVGSKVQLSNAVDFLEDRGFPFVGIKRPLTEITAGSVVQSDSLEGYCACVFELPSDQTLLSRMLGCIVLFPVLAWYLSQVISTEESPGLGPFFVLEPWYWFPRLFNKPQFLAKLLDAEPLPPRYEEELDEDVVAEEARIQEGIRTGQPDAVVLDRLVKLYGKPLPKSQDELNRRQVNGLSVGFKQGQVFALLGHNGAGKTTMTKVLLGSTSVTGGDAYIQGLSVKDKVHATRKYLSTCPQHDVLWDSLSGVEHCIFFGMFQGLGFSESKKRANTLLEKVKLQVAGNAPAGTFSGGMKRRLSVAVCFMGDRPVTFLDEPTTGMDPQNRSHIWELVTEMKASRTVILTTHAMEEADALGDRIGIMKRGVLVALGTSAHLRSKFGGVHRVEVLPKPQCNRQSFVEEARRFAPHVEWYDIEVASASESFKMNLPMGYPDELTSLFDFLRSKSEEGEIQSWIFSGATLEDVFVKLSDEEAPRMKKKWIYENFAKKWFSCGGQEENEEKTKTGHVYVLEDEDHGKEVVLQNLTGKPNVLKQFIGVYVKEFWQFWTNGNVVVLVLIGFTFGIVNSLYKPTAREYEIQRNIRYQDYVGPFDRASLEFKRCMLEEMRQIASRDPENFVGDTEHMFLPELAGFAQMRQRTWYPTLWRTVEKATDLFSQTNLQELDETRVDVDLAGVFSTDFNPMAALAFDNLVRNWSGGESCQEITVSSQEDEGKPVYPHTNKNARWANGEIRPFASSPFGYSIDRLLVAVESNAPGVSEEQLAEAVGSVCPDPQDRPFGEPAATSLESEVGLACIMDNDWYNWPANDLIRFPGESGQRDVLCPLDVVSLDRERLNLEAAKAAHDSLTSTGAGLLSQYPSKVMQQQVPNTNATQFHYDSSPLLCPSQFYDSFERQPGESAESALNRWMARSVGELEAAGVPSPSQDPEVLHLVDEKTAPIALVFHRAQLQDKEAAPELELTLFDYRQFAPFATNNYFDRFPDDVVTQVLTGTGTAAMRQLFQLHGGEGIDGFEESTVTHVGSGDIREQWLYKLRSAHDSLANSAAMFVVTLVLTVLISMIFPQIANSMIVEREHRIRHAMKMAGLKSAVYWVVQYAFWMQTMAVYIMAIYLSFYIASSPLLSLNVLRAIFTYTGLMVALAMVSSTLIKRSMQARSILYLFAVLMVLVAEVVHHIIYVNWDDGFITARDPDSYWWYLLPSNAGYFAIQYALTLSSGGFSWSLSQGAFETVIAFMLAETGALFVITLYLDEVVVQDFGVSKRWWFPLESIAGLCGIRFPDNCCSRAPKANNQLVAKKMQSDFHDASVSQEIQIVHEPSDLEHVPAIYVKSLTKVFPSKPVPKVAVNNLNLRVNRNECFGLLGPNGAGKSTTMSILTGLYPPTSGFAAIDGVSVTNAKGLRSVIGICPQMDLVWPNVTVAQHLNCYARLNGSSIMEMASAVKSVMKAMDIYAFRSKRASDLSGGTRRRLTMAISLIRNPSIWFLDEPSTGVDVDTRRKIWSIIEREKKHRTIVITTHSMEEAEVLCDRVGIMTHGQMRALGSIGQLKRQFATGYVLSVSPVAGAEDRANRFVRNMSRAVTPLPRTAHLLMYAVDEHALDAVVSRMGEAGLQDGVMGYEVRPTSLEDVFMKIAESSEQEYGVA